MGQKDTRGQERRPGCMPEPNNFCSCTIVYGGVWRTELPHTVFMKRTDILHPAAGDGYHCQFVQYTQSAMRVHNTKIFFKICIHLSRGIFALHFPVLDHWCLTKNKPGTSDVFISLNSQQLVLRHSDSHHCVYVSQVWALCLSCFCFLCPSSANYCVWYVDS